MAELNSTMDAHLAERPPLPPGSSTGDGSGGRDGRGDSGGSGTA